MKKKVITHARELIFSLDIFGIILFLIGIGQILLYLLSPEHDKLYGFISAPFIMAGIVLLNVALGIQKRIKRII